MNVILIETLTETWMLECPALLVTVLESTSIISIEIY